MLSCSYQRVLDLCRLSIRRDARKSKPSLQRNSAHEFIHIRRQFLGRTAAIGAGFGVWSGRSPVLRANESAPQGLSAACIGVGGKGSSDTSHIAEQGVSICRFM